MTRSGHASVATTASGRRARRRPLLQWAMVAVAAGLVVVLTGPDLRAQPDEPTEAALAPAPDLYQQHCASCHGNQGAGTFRGPTLVGVGAASADYWLRSGRMPLREPDQEARRGEPIFTDDEIRGLVEFIAGLGDGPAIPEVDLADVDLAAGGELYRLNCASCHNWDGKGGALIGQRNAPPLHPAPNRQVAEAIRIGPGSMPEFTEEQLDDEELDDVIAYVDFLRTPPDAGGYGLGHWGPATETVAAFVALIALVGVTAWLGERRGD